MSKGFRVEPDGSFCIGNRRHQIPETFSGRQVDSYRTLLEPIPDSPSGPSLPAETRRKQMDYFQRRALAVVIPGLPAKAVQTLSIGSVRTIHSWIARYRPELADEVQSTLR